ncbi:hypothetical protein G4V62_11660 [Bacillaceae bacterium SIJ1]|uniref:hypothetical protein n=1 Tax=Litoribacterium kuwaitense TaxID=1398745 RepID=UPI0013EC0393|nr:hypothetical protein [Litoribacterium kuwaitense]NGP45576.1 hypothetical protein [Litoribacterium kuwaitense]
MKKITKTQIVTIIFILGYIIWEIYVREWASTVSGPIIRVDLVIIYPILLLMVFLSIVQLVKRLNR